MEDTAANLDSEAQPNNRGGHFLNSQEQEKNRLQLARRQVESFQCCNLGLEPWPRLEALKLNHLQVKEG